MANKKEEEKWETEDDVETSVVFQRCEALQLVEHERSVRGGLCYFCLNRSSAGKYVR